MLIADCGSTWSKIFDSNSKSLNVLATKDLIREKDLVFDVATGHCAKKRCRRYVNELIALSEGGLSLIEEDDFSLVDVGSRDIKFVRFKSRKLDKLDWNLACGSTTGATVELLAKYYEVDFSHLPPSDKWVNVTCGVFGMERVLEQIAMGKTPEESISMFIHGMVRNVFDFIGRPAKVYLSGGFCENRTFLETFKIYADVIPLGRAVLIEGLKIMVEKGEIG